MRLPWECQNQSQDTNWRHCVTGPELSFFHKRKGVLKIDQSVKMPLHRLSMGVASSCSSAPVGVLVRRIFTIHLERRSWFFSSGKIFVRLFLLPRLTNAYTHMQYTNVQEKTKEVILLNVNKGREPWPPPSLGLILQRNSLTSARVSSMLASFPRRLALKDSSRVPHPRATLVGEERVTNP